MINKTRYSLLLATSIALGGCGTADLGEPPLPEEKDTTAPTISIRVDNKPYNGSTKVDPVFDKVSLKFSETITNFDISQVQLMADGSPIDGTWSHLPDTNELYFDRTGIGLNRNAPLFDKSIQISLPDSLQDVDGNGISAAIRNSLIISTAGRLSLTMIPDGLATGTSFELKVEYRNSETNNAYKLYNNTNTTINFDGSNQLLIPNTGDYLWVKQRYRLSLVTQPAGHFCHFDTDFFSSTGEVTMGDSDAIATLYCTSVTPISSDATRWGDYVKVDPVSGAFVKTATTETEPHTAIGASEQPESCRPLIPGDEANFDAHFAAYRCIHAGEIRQYHATLISPNDTLTCDDIQVYDVPQTSNQGTSLGFNISAGTTLSQEAIDASALDWACTGYTDTAEGRVFELTSSRLKDNKRLIDLISYSYYDPEPNNIQVGLTWFFDWIKRSVVVTTNDNTVLHNSGYSRWWGNLIQRMTGTTFSDPGNYGYYNHDIYVMTENHSTPLLIDRTSHLSITSIGNYKFLNEAATLNSIPNFSTYTNFLWLDVGVKGSNYTDIGTVSDTGATIPRLHAHKLLNSVIRNAEISNGWANYTGDTELTYTDGDGIGLRIENARGNRFENLILNRNQGDAVVLTGNNKHNLLTNLNIRNNYRNGLVIGGTSSNNRFSQLVVANNGIDTNIAAASVAGNGVVINAPASYNFLTKLRSYNNLQNGLSVDGIDNAVSFSILAGNGSDGATITSTGNTLLHNTVRANGGNGLNSAAGNMLDAIISTGNAGTDINLTGDFAGNTSNLRMNATNDSCADVTTGTDCTALVTGTATSAFPSPDNYATPSYSVVAADWTFGLTDTQTWGAYPAPFTGRCVNEVDNYQCGLNEHTLETSAIADYSYSATPVETTHTNSADASNVTYDRTYQEVLNDFNGNDNGLCEPALNEVCTVANRYGAIQ